MMYITQGNDSTDLHGYFEDASQHAYATAAFLVSKTSSREAHKCFDFFQNKSETTQYGHFYPMI